MSEGMAKLALVAGTAVVSSALAYFYCKETNKHDGSPAVAPVAPAAAPLSLATSASTASVAGVPLPLPTPSHDPKNKEGKWLPLRETERQPRLDPNSLKDRLTLNDVDFDGKRVLVRVDYNCPISVGVVTDSARIDATIPTLEYILEKKGPLGGAKCIVLIAHLGQPTGAYRKEDFSLFPCVAVLKRLLKREVVFLPDCVGAAIERATHECAPGTVFLCENLRFHMEEIGSGEDAKGAKVKSTAEEKNLFQENLSKLGDVFVFEAFGAAHRPHSSISGIRIPIRVPGLLMRKELDFFASVLGTPSKPVLAILGGAKVSDKILVIENLLDICDEMIIGGGMAYTFKKILHKVDIGKSVFDSNGAKAIDRIMRKAADRGVRMHFPVDHVIADKFSADARTGVTDDAAGVPATWMALDIGPRSRALFSEVCGRANTILWNGPMGVFEKGPFAAGTLSVMCDCVIATKRGAQVVIGGGDTGAASSTFYYQKESCAEQVTHVSTGGGSSLVLMEGKMLPGVEGLSIKSSSSSATASAAAGAGERKESAAPSVAGAATASGAGAPATAAAQPRK